jgi:hypothetical protein
MGMRSWYWRRQRKASGDLVCATWITGRAADDAEAPGRPSAHAASEFSAIPVSYGTVRSERQEMPEVIFYTRADGWARLVALGRNGGQNRVPGLDWKEKVRSNSITNTCYY